MSATSPSRSTAATRVNKRRGKLPSVCVGNYVEETTSFEEHTSFEEAPMSSSNLALISQRRPV